MEELHNLLQEDVQIVLLGTGDPAFEQSFAWFGHAYPEKISANILLMLLWLKKFTQRAIFS